MKAVKMSSTYESPLREEQKEATRQRILEVAGRLMEDRGLREFSYAVIAEEARVTERTVYRHFPNKGALLEGLWGWYQARVHYGDIVQTEQELLAQPLRTFPAFEENAHVSRALWLSPQGRDFRLSNVEERKAGIKAAEPRQLAASPHARPAGSAPSFISSIRARHCGR